MEIVTQIIDELLLAALPGRDEFMRRMAPTSGMEMLGVPNPAVQKLVKRLWSALKELDPADYLTLCKQLVVTCIFEANHMAFELLWKNKAALRLVGRKEIEELGANIDNWATVDTLSVLVSGWVWREGGISDDDVLRWLQSENRWWRRLAVVSTITLNLKSRGGTGDTKRTLMVCEKVVDERDEMIVKALSWALRVLTTQDRDTVEAFIKKYDERLASRVKREVYRKLTTGKKNG